MSFDLLRNGVGVFVLGTSLIAGGCNLINGGRGDSSSNDEPEKREAVEKKEDKKPDAEVGVYPPAPEAAKHPRIGVPPFKVSAVNGRREAGLDDMAADQFTTLLDQWGGFKMIERAQLGQIFKEQNLPGIAPGEVPTPNKIRGVDYIVIGKITNLSMKRETAKSGWQVAGFGRTGKDVRITTACGIDMRLVDPSTGEIVCSNQTNYKQVLDSSSSGQQWGPFQTGGENNIDLTDDDRGELLRLAIDQAIRKSIPKFEKVLKDYNAAPAK